MGINSPKFQTQFFAHLTTIGLITQESFLTQLSSFISVLDEPGVPFERASMAAICAGEGLMRVRGTNDFQSHYLPHPLGLSSTSFIFS